MGGMIGRLFALALMVVGCVSGAAAQQTGARIALVIGNGAYANAPLATAANDAGLVAQTLTAAGFDVTGARDLDGEGLRRAFREFLEKANAAGPDAIAFVYLSGYGLQFDGENYVLPVDATLARDSDIPIQAVRLSDFDHALAGVPLRARVVVVDGAYTDPLVPASEHVAPGLALVDPDPESLLAFNAAPGTVAPPPAGTYGVYGQTLAEMMRAGGVPVDEVFDRVRLKVNEATKGAVVPWDASKLTTAFVFLDKAPDAPAAPDAGPTLAAISKAPLRSLPVQDAYSAAVARDTFPAYQEFVTAYPDSPYTKRVRTLVAVRREALTWQQTVTRNTSAAYWTYLRRYPRGPHLYDCRRRLALIAAPPEPPPSFDPIEYDVPPPPPIEEEIVERPIVELYDDDEPPPPPPPLYVLPPEDPEFVDLPPPPLPEGPGFLPIPIPVPIIGARPARDPGFIVPPRTVPGQYAQPRPFRADPDGRLMPQPRPDRGPPGGALPGVERNGPGDQRPGGLPPQNAQGIAPNQPVPRDNRPVLPLAGPAGLPGQPQDPARLLQQQQEQQRLQQQGQQQRQDQLKAQQEENLRQQQLRQQQDQQRLQQQGQQQRQDQLKAQQEENLRQQQLQQQQQENARRQQLRQQQDQQRQQQEQQRTQQLRQQQEQQQRALQLQQEQRQRQQQEQQRAQQQRAQEQQRAQQEQRAQQMRQQEQQRAQQQRAQEQQRAQQEQRAQQMRQQQEQQRAQQQRAQEQQRAQQEQRAQQMRQQQEQQRAQQHQGRPECGHPGQPPCR